MSGYSHRDVHHDHIPYIPGIFQRCQYSLASQISSSSSILSVRLCARNANPANYSHLLPFLLFCFHHFGRFDICCHVPLCSNTYNRRDKKKANEPLDFLIQFPCEGRRKTALHFFFFSLLHSSTSTSSKSSECVCFLSNDLEIHLFFF